MKVKTTILETLPSMNPKGKPEMIPSPLANEYNYISIVRNKPPLTRSHH